MILPITIQVDIEELVIERERVFEENLNIISLKLKT